ncbi:Sentrin-specific protease 7 [Bienertia sinuspersici]
MFFPIAAHENYYVFCINMTTKDWTLDILDNRLLERNINFRSKYKDYPTKMVKKCICKIHGSKRFSNTKGIQNMRSRLIKMPWRNNSNKSDCGVFVMGHMETYIRQEAGEWECGLHPDDVRCSNFTG